MPDPDGPMIAVNSPARKSRETESTAVTRVSPEPKILVRSATLATTADPSRDVVGSATVDVVVVIMFSTLRSTIMLRSGVPP